MRRTSRCPDSRLVPVIAILLYAGAVSAAPTPYRFLSVHSEDGMVNGFHVAGGGINNHGVMVVALQDPQVVYTIDWPVWLPVWEADIGTNDGFRRPVINDSGEVGGVIALGNGNQRLVRIETDTSVTVLADDINECPDPGDFCTFGHLGRGFNAAGQFALMAAHNLDGELVSGVWRFDDIGPVEIARVDFVSPDGLFSFSTPSINNAGIVAFGAQAVNDLNGMDVYTGTGGAVSYEGTPPYPLGGGISNVLINDAGVFGVQANGGYVLDDGAFTTVFPPEFGVSGPTMISFNDAGDMAILGCIGNACGIFTGDDPVDDAVIRAGNALFDGTVSIVTGGVGAFRMTQDALSDDHDIVFKVQIDVDGQVESHLVRAFALLAQYDSDDDGIGNDIDNCLTLFNPDQVDSNGDGFGNRCDADLDDDGIVNFADVAAMKAVFLSNDADADLDGNGTVAFGDLAIVKSFFLKSPGPSALTP